MSRNPRSQNFPNSKFFFLGPWFQALTIYALFGDDFRLCVTHKQTDELFNALTLVPWLQWFKDSIPQYQHQHWILSRIWYIWYIRTWILLYSENLLISSYFTRFDFSRLLTLLWNRPDAKFACLVFGAEIVANSLGTSPGVESHSHSQYRNFVIVSLSLGFTRYFQMRQAEP